MSDTADPSFDRRRPFLAHRLRDRYEFIHLLGQGGTGAVYEVRNLRLERIEALKVLGESLDGEAAERFAHEAKVAASLNHPRIVKIHDFGMEGNVHWFSMDLVDGPTLGRLLKDHGPFELPVFARALIPVLDALEHAHGLGIIHRDLKPANILVNQEGRPYLADFGVAKSKESMLRTQTGLFLGTPAYIAPEQALTGGADLRADLYSMGALMYHLLSGQLPFKGDTPLQIVVARLDKDPVPIRQLRPGLPLALADIVATAMAKDRELRYGSAAQMRDALRSACQDAGVAWEGPITGLPLPPCARITLPPLPAQDSQEELPGPAVRRPPRSWRWALAIAGVLVAAGFGLRSRPRKIPPPATQAPAPAVAVPAAQPPPKNPSRPLPVQKAAPIHAAPARETAPVPMSYPQLEQTFPPEGNFGGDCAGKRVILTLTVGEDGSVQACRILAGAAPACAEAARKAAMRYRFRPALDSEGRPIKAATTIALEFPENP
jgi:serine/threonine-protein kinase